MKNKTLPNIIPKHLLDIKINDKISVSGGVSVAFLHKVHSYRKEDLRKAINSLILLDKPIPEDWVIEYNEILKEC